MQKGALVVVWRDNGEALLTRTRSEVEDGPMHLVFVEGLDNPYALDAVREVVIHPSAKVYVHPLLENWAGRALEFLDYFDGCDEEDSNVQEAQALQEEGLKLGLMRIYPPKKEEEDGTRAD